MRVRVKTSEGLCTAGLRSFSMPNMVGWLDLSIFTEKLQRAVSNFLSSVDGNR